MFLSKKSSFKALMLGVFTALTLLGFSAVTYATPARTRVDFRSSSSEARISDNDRFSYSQSSGVLRVTDKTTGKTLKVFWNKDHDKLIIIGFSGDKHIATKDQRGNILFDGSILFKKTRTRGKRGCVNMWGYDTTLSQELDKEAMIGKISALATAGAAGALIGNPSAFTDFMSKAVTAFEELKRGKYAGLENAFLHVSVSYCDPPAETNLVWSIYEDEAHTKLIRTETTTMKVDTDIHGPNPSWPGDPNNGH